ncbi:multi-sensor signal transduction histidine kinase [Richelia sinica FACHB-800]|uniref:histidine kinase n=1 Tax=Richelia sinica FACHB-800 TaxID=1357546 RepID=A0A975TBP2_9NOST|nr:ATP-binding protein [Richelia sinica]MBD2665698.1 amino acid permease [Richelia sinica FACHB-800]QXE25780.1 multi-sensor signal transduction histidine kinase [Richelia sinica FACHB-800]
MLHPDPIPRHQSAGLPLTRSLSALETWGFGLTGHILWIAMIPAIHAALGAQAMFVWIPAVIFGMLLNYQMANLGKYFVHVAGGTPNYASKLLKPYPSLATYAALGYYFSWVSVLPVNAIVLTDLIKVNLETLHIACPHIALEIAFTLLPFVLAFSGTRALSILHLFFVIPACGLLLAFSGQGLSWLAFSNSSPGFFPDHWSSLSFQDWAKWFLFVTYGTYACETASSFVADSHRPQKTLLGLKIAAWLMIPIYLGGSWVVMRLATNPEFKDSAYLNLLGASTSFWGKSAPLMITFLLAASCLLACATVVSNCPRILYQMAQDKYLSPVFAVVSHRGVFGPALTLTLLLSLTCLIWGNVAQIVVIGNVGWFISIMVVHLALWLRRNKPGVWFPRISLGILLLEIVVLLVGGLAWGKQEFILGLLLPIGIMGIDRLMVHLSFPVFRPHWWISIYKSKPVVVIKDSVMVQVTTLIFLLCSAVTAGWIFGQHIHKPGAMEDENLAIVLLMTVAFVGVAIACWTSLPQVVEIAEAREAAEHLFTVALDGILVVDEQGIILQANPATESLFAVNPSILLGSHLKQWLPQLDPYPEKWTGRSEHTLIDKHHSITLEVSISNRIHQSFREYVIILHDITKRKQAEQILRNSEAKLREEAALLATQLVQSEKMSSLGQLVAGVAHEINNPVTFIYGNLIHAEQYIEDLVELIKLYQQHSSYTVPEIQEKSEAIDTDFLLTDLPKLLNSIKIGAERIREIVLSLRNFSRLDESEMKAVNIHDGINSTLMILEHRLKATSERPAIKLIKEYGKLPLVECYPGQLNQVFMNILANAIDALEEAFTNNEKMTHLQILIKTEVTDAQQVIIRIADNGMGVPEKLQKLLFDPFFTTKPVGKGTGLGLSISYKIITEKHQGKLRCISSPGQGTEFAIAIPLHQP